MTVRPSSDESPTQGPPQGRIPLLHSPLVDMYETDTMIVPVIFDSQQYTRSTPPELGQQVTVELVWNESFSRSWARLRPGWSPTAELTATDETVTHLGATPQENTQMQQAIGTIGTLRFGYTSPIPVPPTLTIARALRATATATDLAPRRPNIPVKAWSDTLDEHLVTTGTVERIQLVSILFDLRPRSYPGWYGLQPIPGTEWFYDLAHPPTQLHKYRPAAPDLVDPDDQSEPELHTEPSDPIRVETLLLDFAVAEK